ncbi:MAG: hypothetical protein RLZZ621_971 [Gemmatimonadota bacterium]|jgi:prepilin peptidase CpaA
MVPLSLFIQLALITAGVLTDCHSRRIANGLVLVLLLHGLGASWLFDTPARDVTGALSGVAMGLALWFPAWLRGILGAGDVKFFAAGAAWIGPSLTWRTALVAALLGGVYAAWWLLRHRLQASPRPIGPMPYAVPLGCALVLATLAPHVVRSWWVWL